MTSVEDPTAVEELNTTNMSMLFNSTNGTDPMIAESQSPLRQILNILSTVVLAFVMVGMGCAVDYQVVLKHLKRPTGIIVGFLCRFGIMPAVAALLATVFKMPSEQTLALLIIGSCPGGAASSVAAYWVDGDMSLSITMTTVSCAVGMGMMPLLLFIYTKTYDLGNLQVPFETIGIALATLLIPIALGVLMKVKRPNLAKKVLKVCAIFGIIAIIGVLTVFIVVYNSVFSLSGEQITCAAIFPGVGMVLGYGLSSLISLIKPFFLTHSQRRTVCIETGIQNTKLASAVILLSNFPLEATGKMVVFPLVYLASQVAWTVLLAGGYRVYIRFEKKSNTECEEKDINGSVDVKEDFASLEFPCNQVDAVGGLDNKAYTDSDKTRM